MTLGELASVIRSKNAGPFLLTFDILFENESILEAVRASGMLTADRVAACLGLGTSEIGDFAYYPFACAVKFTVRRARPSGSRFDTDVYGAQQYAPLLGLEIALETREKHAR